MRSFYLTTLVSFFQLFTSLLVVDAVESVFISEFFSTEPLSYKSYVGNFSSDDSESDIHLRTDVSNNFFINNKRTFRIKTKASPTFGETDGIEEELNQIIFETTHNGWLRFREDIADQTMVFKHPAKILPSNPELGKSYKYKAYLTEESNEHGIVSYHTVVEGLEPIAIPNGTFEALKINQEQRIKIASDEKLKDVIYAATNYHSYWLVEGVGIVRRTTESTYFSDESSDSINLQLELVASNNLPNYLWPTSEVTHNGWKNVSWFGYLTDDFFPWIYHKDHGWLWIEAKDTSDIKIWSESLGWWITSAELYPTFYSMDLQEWLTYSNSKALERTFVRSDGSVVKASLNGFSISPELSKPPTSSSGSLINQEGDQEYFDTEGTRYVDSEGGFTQNSGEVPTVEILSPFEGTEVEEGEKFLILVDAKDKDGEITQVKIKVNGSLVALLEDVPYQTTFTANNSDENYRIQAIAEDNDGNVTESELLTIQSDLQDDIIPEIRVYSPVNKSVIKTNEKIYVQLKASDEDGFIEKVYLLVDGIPVGNPLRTPPYKFAFRPPVDGSYQISGRAVDDDGNEGFAQSVTVSATKSGIAEGNEESPSVRIETPLNKTEYTLGDTVAISVEATDADGQVDEVRIFVDGIQVGRTMYNSPYRLNYTPPVSGSYVISATAEDNDENMATATSISFKVN